MCFVSMGSGPVRRAICSHVMRELLRRVAVGFLHSHAVNVLESKHVCDAGAEPRVTTGGAAARKLPRGRQRENPYPGQPVALARAPRRQTAATAQRAGTSAQTLPV